MPDFWPNLNFLLRHLIVFVLWRVIFRRILDSCRLIFDEKIMAQSAFIYKKTYHSYTLTYGLVDSKFPSFILFYQHGKLTMSVQQLCWTTWPHSEICSFSWHKFCCKHPHLPSWSNLKLFCSQWLQVDKIHEFFKYSALVRNHSKITFRNLKNTKQWHIVRSHGSVCSGVRKLQSMNVLKLPVLKRLKWIEI